MSKYKHVFSQSQIKDFKSQIKLVHAHLKLSAKDSVYDKSKPNIKITLSLSALQNIIARQLNYTSFSELQLHTKKRAKHPSSVPLYDMINVDEVAEYIIPSTENMTMKEVTSALSGLTSLKHDLNYFTKNLANTNWAVSPEEYPFVFELYTVLDGKIANHHNYDCEPDEEYYASIKDGYYKFLNRALECERDMDFNRYCIEYESDMSVGILGGNATRYFKSLKQLDMFIGSRIDMVRSGYLGDSWEYLNKHLLDVNDTDVADIIKTDPPLNYKVEEIDGLSDDVLIGYCEIHNQTERALFSGHQLKRLRYLAGSIRMPHFTIKNDEFAANKELVDVLLKSAKRIKEQFTAD